MVKVAAVVPAAGCGHRMGSDIKKQFLTLAGVPILGYVLRILEASLSVQAIVLAVGEGEEEYCRQAVVEKLGLRKIAAIVHGGKERQDSVYSGLLALAPDTDIVVIHDGVRPLLRDENLEMVIGAAMQYGAATCAVPVKDTVKLAQADSFVAETLPRDRLWLTQTPQAFRYEAILNAHRCAREANFRATDDAALVERLGMTVKLVYGNYQNIKITTPEDLVVASALLKAAQAGGDQQ
ncbi:MAG: 2-C-methyl-D-erythritol 4-phosphate cytidylyltransferase [Desulfotomaculaceae bacterium]|nr:2-C-methyl-D-erythritol 4-phosphate cytidylyltransferase [Desulfotomaculaceae bacterium]